MNESKSNETRGPAPPEKGNAMSPKLAKWIRIFTLPQVMALIAIAFLWGDYPPGHGWFAALALTGLPLLSYAVWRAVPALHARGRDTQRKLAVIFSVSGYGLGLALFLAEGGRGTELFVYLAYALTGALVAVSPRLFGSRASGHAAGTAGPVMILALRKSPWFLLGLGLLLPVFSSSRALGRHTSRELWLGTAHAIVSALILALLFR